MRRGNSERITALIPRQPSRRWSAPACSGCRARSTTSRIYYKCNRFAVIGNDEDVLWPSYSRVLDFELEFGCFIKKAAKDVPVASARDYIFGYTIFNDFTARDAQNRRDGRQLRPAKGKDFDTANAMGPCLVTADEMKEPYNLTMIARVNGEEWGRGKSDSMYWSFEDLIAWISRSETIHPGEFLGSGTVGNGCGLEQDAVPAGRRHRRTGSGRNWHYCATPYASASKREGFNRNESGAAPLRCGTQISEPSGTWIRRCAGVETMRG